MTRLKPSTGSPLERFEARVLRGEKGECWEWAGTKSHAGYALVGINYDSVSVHRLAYELFVGAIPSDLYIDHLCRNRGCVNPEHLEPVTNAANVLRGEGLMAQNARKTHCKNGHEFTPENTYAPPKRPGIRDCRTCRRANDRTHYRKSAA